MALRLEQTEFLIIGAGPYGLAAAAYAKSLGVDVTVVGRTLDFWKSNMPRGMFLRSGPDWHLDAREAATFEAYLHRRGLTPAEIKPIPLDTFLDYAKWFMAEYAISPRNTHIDHLTRSDGEYVASLDDGSRLRARKVLLGLGFAFFKHCPEEVTRKLPPGSFTHTCDAVDFDQYHGMRVLIVGGRQSAFEWAALIREQGAEEVHVVYRHPTPTFTQPDWSWVKPMVWQTLQDHAWWRKLAPGGKERIQGAFWKAGRLILEEWLAARVHQPNIYRHEMTCIDSAGAQGDSTYEIRLSDNSKCNVHHIILATGYQPAMDNVAFLDRATILDRLSTIDGFPALDPEFQTSVPGLYISGLAATRDFGPFFGFNVGCPVAAKIIGDAVMA